MSITTYALLRRYINDLDARIDGIIDAHAPIYGVYWNKGTSPTLTRTHSAVGLSAAVGTGGSFAANDFDALPIWGEMGPVADSYGNVFIRVPKFYIRKTDGADFKTWAVSKYQYPGFYLPWCFWDFTNNVELPYVDIGKYKGTSDGGGTPKLESKPDKYPLSNQHIVTFRTMAQANNTGGLLGYQQLDVHGYDVLQTLMTIEFATLNMQTIMRGYADGYYGVAHVALVAEAGVNRIVITNAQGAVYRVGQTISIHLAAQSATPHNLPATYGRTITAIDVDTPAAGQTRITFDGDPVNIALNDFVMNTGRKNGFSAAIAASSGSIVDNTNGKHPCMYRGIESPYGDMWQVVDGINITDRQAWVCANAASYASNVFASPYVQLGYVNHDVNSYVMQMGWDASNPFAAFPVSVQASATQYYCDYYYQVAGTLIARVGGAWALGANVGPWCWSLNGSSAFAFVNVGGRLLRKAV